MGPQWHQGPWDCHDRVLPEAEAGPGWPLSIMRIWGPVLVLSPGDGGVFAHLRLPLAISYYINLMACALEIVAIHRLDNLIREIVSEKLILSVPLTSFITC